jgi:hypothetical protein
VGRATRFKTRLLSAVLAAVTIGLLGGSSIAMAQAAGTLDVTFGNGGTVAPQRWRFSPMATT